MKVQVKVDSNRLSSGWKDREIDTDLQQVAVSLYNNSFDLSQLTVFVTDFIGTRVSSWSSWDDMDFELVSYENDVLKIAFVFGGIHFNRGADVEGTPVNRSGIITLMPGV